MIEVRALTARFGLTTALDGVSFSMAAGEAFGIVGESGSGKSTLGLAILRLISSDGPIVFMGNELQGLRFKEMRPFRRDMQIVFQDPYGSLSPRMSVAEIIKEGLKVHHPKMSNRERDQRVIQALNDVGLDPEMRFRFPHEFSGGQRQRIAVARALAINPEFVIADEPVSALDVSIRAQVLNLLQSLQQRFNLTYLFVSHDLSVVRHVADRIAVMYLGKIVELGDRDEIYSSPKHPYTRALLSAVPIPDPQIEKRRQRIILSGDLPSPIKIPSGCRFHTRCPMAQDICREIEPAYEAKEGREHYAACHFSEKVTPV